MKNAYIVSLTFADTWLNGF